MNLTLPPLYKKLMLLAIVIGPIYWLMLTDDGQRRTDLVLLSLMDKPSVGMRLDVLGPEVGEEAIHKLYPDTPWQCEDKVTDFGSRVCHAAIGAFNDTPAQVMVFYLHQGALNAMKVVYRGGYHEWLVGQTARMLGRAERSQSDPASPAVLRWDTGKGTLVIQEEVRSDGEPPSLLWLSKALVSP